jgi:hypothetical protein
MSKRTGGRIDISRSGCKYLNHLIARNPVINQDVKVFHVPHVWRSPQAV